MDLYKKLVIPFWVILTLGLIAALAYAWIAVSMQRSVEAYFEPPPEVIDTTGPVILQAIQSLGRLETTRVVVKEQLTAGKAGRNWYERMRHKDLLKMNVVGFVYAGFDLKTLSADAITVTPEQITINLGAPKILISKISSAHTNVYFRDVGLFNSPDIGLESRARQSAEANLPKHACRAKILQRAAVDGERFMRPFVTSISRRIGDQRPVVVIAEVPARCG